MWVFEFSLWQKNAMSKISKTPLLDKYASLINQKPEYRNLDDSQKETRLRGILGTTYLDLTDDFAFKYVFGGNEKCIIPLLNDVLDEEVLSVEYLQNELQGTGPDSKRVFVDVRCHTARRDFIVEMQNYKREDFKNRLFYYGAADIHNQLSRGEDYAYDPVYIIAFINFRYRHEPHVDNKLIYTYQMAETTTHELYGNQMRIILCELDRLRDMNDSSGKPDSVTECFQIVRNIANFVGRESGIPERYRPVFERARIAGLDESDTAKYIDSMLTKEDIQSYKNAAYADGREDGFDEGLAKGRAEGREEGREEERRLLVLRMLSNGMDIKSVSEMTGLSEDKINELISD